MPPKNAISRLKTGTENGSFRTLTDNCHYCVSKFVNVNS